jgi:hypothetical protein
MNADLIEKLKEAKQLSEKRIDISKAEIFLATGYEEYAALALADDKPEKAKDYLKTAIRILEGGIR